MKIVRILLVFSLGILLHQTGLAQQRKDTVPPYLPGQNPPPIRSADTNLIKRKQPKDKPYKVDTLAKRVHDPRRATLYSTFFPGLGQFYNRKYWKVPLAWAGVGIPAYFYFDNKKWYHKCQFAIAILDRY